MTGMHRKYGWPLWAVRTSLEVSVLVIGWLLGGNVGIGTLAFALAVGPMINYTMPLLRIPPAVPARKPAAAADTSAERPLETGEAG